MIELYDAYNKRSRDHMQKLRIKDKALYEIKTPLPNSNHHFCSVCHEQYDNYREHISSVKHGISVSEDRLFLAIDDVIIELDRKCGSRKEVDSQDGALMSAEKNSFE